jgi:hypothetical protein
VAKSTTYKLHDALLLGVVAHAYISDLSPTLIGLYRADGIRRCCFSSPDALLAFLIYYSAAHAGSTFLRLSGFAPTMWRVALEE